MRHWLSVPQPQPLAPTLLLSVPVNLTTLRVFSWPAWSRSIMSSGLRHVEAGVRICFLFKAERYSIVQVDHTMLLRSSVSGASIFQPLGITVLWTQGCKHLTETLLSLPSTIAGSCANSVLNVWGIPGLFSTLAAPVHIPTHSGWGSHFLTSSPTLVFCYFDSSHPNGCEVVSHCDSCLHLPSD